MTSTTPTNTSTIRLSIAVTVGICIGLVLGMILFSTSSSDSIQSINFQDFCPAAAMKQQQQQSSSKRDEMKSVMSPPTTTSIDSVAVTVHHHTKENIDPDSSSSSIFSKENHLPWPCDTSFDLSQIRERYANMQKKSDKIGAKLFSKDTLHQTVKHFRTTMSILKDESFRRCWNQINQNRKAATSKSPASTTAKGAELFFYDLGSRKLDQTMNFLNLYPGANQYNIICFEPNPSFNQFYQKTPNKKIFHLNAAVGIARDSLVLSNRHVGSSIIKEKQVQKEKSNVDVVADKNNSSSASEVVVRVLPFLDALLGTRLESESWTSYEATNQNGKKIPLPVAASSLMMMPRNSRKVIVKMDVEKAEFAIIHHLLRTGALSMIDEFLLECHYNTNLPREKRDPELHIGYDDCVDLVNAIRDASSPSSSMEVVLWNSVKTATRTGRGYIESRNGFYPT